MYENDTTHGEADFVDAAAAICILAFLFLVGRYCAHFRLNRVRSIEDVFITVAWLLSIPHIVVAYHVSDLSDFVNSDSTPGPTPSTFVLFFKYVYASIHLYNTSLSLIKLSILFQYRRLFPLSSVTRLITPLLIFVVLQYIFLVLINIFVCHPISYFWTSWAGPVTNFLGKEEGTCLPIFPIFLASSLLSVLTSLIVLLLPIPVILSSRLSSRFTRNRRISLILLFSVGAATFLILAILRIWIFHSMTSTNPREIVRKSRSLAVWGHIETGVGVIGACIPELRAVWLRAFPRGEEGETEKRRAREGGTAGDDIGDLVFLTVAGVDVLGEYGGEDREREAQEEEEDAAAERRKKGGDVVGSEKGAGARARETGSGPRRVSWEKTMVVEESPARDDEVALLENLSPVRHRANT
ncbi:hypothetical protein CAC42_803 [Sphaceloma murrayae]|uniref:Rhodopsin domain-containing protein n=1 Tax=Sphaceloma murrayae TaxID=2082308 RepID=A0A2K1QK54_9PEZI|nr:hypothetical protein CAC42_803 [Sphaceloma murrayae]